jgi:hypothetical protein
MPLIKPGSRGLTPRDDCRGESGMTVLRNWVTEEREDEMTVIRKKRGDCNKKEAGCHCSTSVFKEKSNICPQQRTAVSSLSSQDNPSIKIQRKRVQAPLPQIESFLERYSATLRKDKALLKFVQNLNKQYPPDVIYGSVIPAIINETLQSLFCSSETTTPPLSPSTSLFSESPRCNSPSLSSPLPSFPSPSITQSPL